MVSKEESMIFSLQMDVSLRKEMKEVCEILGITMSKAFILFAKSLVQQRKFPVRVNSRAFVDLLTIDGKMEKTVQKLKKKFGTGIRVRRADILKIITQYDVSEKSIIVRNYCVNLLIPGCDFFGKKFFEYCRWETDSKKFKILDEDPKYDGIIYLRHKTEWIAVGKYNSGVAEIWDTKLLKLGYVYADGFVTKVSADAGDKADNEKRTETE